ncbi:MAG TPA: excisionase family DNA-binding protein [Allosphingosinicella sp.]|jgi:excisionase family DNA binding protein
MRVKSITDDTIETAARPITVRIREACRLTGMGRSKLYMLIAEGHIEVVKVGSMTLIPFRSLEKFLGVDAR